MLFIILPPLLFISDPQSVIVRISFHCIQPVDTITLRYHCKRPTDQRRDVPTLYTTPSSFPLITILSNATQRRPQPSTPLDPRGHSAPNAHPRSRRNKKEADWLPLMFEPCKIGGVVTLLSWRYEDASNKRALEQHPEPRVLSFSGL